ncbi:NADH dehydrogenase [ubiquinone] iron-sulfur protein 6, mitochondrial-like [Trichosurus vulpecula]|uniref:NADH dehydrogenase [ubiquinone] iron-sulfur protein 6, mitochondrial-like n=1 Tax=Trichosurus vulpecula TaxID=9337 RepID=UPI00186AC729|nr:NADH dehydrogenase [ubiquinone] iron-sulfur protein 6, mitochondrial-like [Trichosurus vulpecula]
MVAVVAGMLTFGCFLGHSLGATWGLHMASRCFGVKISPLEEKITYMGQVYDEEDYRRTPFVGCQKEVNENFAVDLISEQPVSRVESEVLSCDGGGGALGHPKVYINLDQETKNGTCGYRGLQFKYHHHH